MHNRILIVVGMHRSGTSLITNWLHHCGLNVGESLLGPGLGNDEGHYEDVDFYKIHLEILRDNKLHDSGLLVDPAIVLSQYHKEKIRNIIRQRNETLDQWAWKDPRTCLFLDFYREAMPDAYQLIVFRDYQSVVISLLKRTFTEVSLEYTSRKGYFSKLVWNKFRRKRQQEKFYHQNAAFFLRVWCYYNQAILENIKSLPDGKFIVVNYQMLNTMDADLIGQIKNDWNFSLDPVPFSGIFNESLLSKPFDVERYIHDEELVGCARRLTEQLEGYARQKSAV